MDDGERTGMHNLTLTCFSAVASSLWSNVRILRFCLHKVSDPGIFVEADKISVEIMEAAFDTSISFRYLILPSMT